MLELRVKVARPDDAELTVQLDAKLLINGVELLDAARSCDASRCASRIVTAHGAIDLRELLWGGTRPNAAELALELDAKLLINGLSCSTRQGRAR